MNVKVILKENFTPNVTVLSEDGADITDRFGKLTMACLAFELVKAHISGGGSCELDESLLTNIDKVEAGEGWKLPPDEDNQKLDDLRIN